MAGLTLLCWWWFGAASSSPEAVRPSLPGVASLEPEAQRLLVQAQQSERQSEQRSTEGEPQLPALASTPDPRFQGRGRVRGALRAAPGALLPREWSLVLEASSVLPGRQLAEPRELFFHQAELEFTIGDLALGGYCLVARGAGLASRPLELLLERGNDDPWVELELCASGELYGSLQEASGAPADGCAVFALDEHSRRWLETKSDVRGRWSLGPLPAGRYTLHYGAREKPLVAARVLDLVGKPLELPTLRLPPLGALRIHVLDARRAPLQGVRVLGSSSSGGVVDAPSDAAGEVRVRHLPPGRYRLRASHALDGEAFGAFDLAAEQTLEVELVFERRAR